MKSLFRRCLASHSTNAATPPASPRHCAIEVLEPRIAPASMAVLNDGTLLITGNPDGPLEITQTSGLVGTNTVITTTVSDDPENATPFTFTGVKNIVVKLPKSATDDNQVNVTLLKLRGALEILTPEAANTNIQINAGESGTERPIIGKGVLIKGGTGVESANVSGVDIRDGMVFAAGKGADSLIISGDVSIEQNLSVTGAATFTLAPGARVNGNLLVTQTQSHSEFFTLGAGSVVTGETLIFAGPGSTTISAYGSVGGRFVASAGDGPSAFNVALTAKSLKYTSGDSNDFISLLRSDISGSATFVLSSGSNSMLFDSGPSNLRGDFKVGKSLKISGGGGNDVYNLRSFDFEVRAGGNAALLLGGGDNTLVWNGAVGGDAIRIVAAGGPDIVNVFDLDAPKAELDLELGGNNDRLAISSNFRKAILDGGSGTDEIIPGSILPNKSVVRRFETGVSA